MAQPIDLAGQKFGRLNALEMGDRDHNRNIRWLCKCDCGKLLYIPASRLRNGNSRSCGCARKEVLPLNFKKAHEQNTRHGASIGGMKTPEYAAWQTIKNRCSKSSSAWYRHDRMIEPRVCDRWQNSFENFLADVGPRPSSSHVLTRHNKRGDFEPGNCIWMTQQELRSHMQINHYVEIDGSTYHVSEAIRRFSTVAEGTVSSRISRGWNTLDAILTPARQYRPKKSMSA